ncbi:MAG: putative nucleic acid-binding Zn-ribbon protein [Polaribacter sp.]|jgi:predicted  nucleic acid-binding Zn-ribbon protein
MSKSILFMANTTELSIEEKLKNLHELQVIDSEIDQIAILKGELPMEVDDLEDEVGGLQTRVNKLSGVIKDMEDVVARHRGNITEAGDLITKYEKQMDNVKNNREYDALSKELELQRLEVQLSEKKSREIQAQLGTKMDTRKVAEGRLEQKKTDLQTKKVELESIIEKTVKEEEKLRKKSDKAQKSIDVRLLKAYTKIRKAYRNGLAVVTIERHSCGGCFNKIPPQIQLEISLKKKIIACEHCGRVLVDDEVAGIIRPIIVEEPKKKRTSRKKPAKKV